MLSCKLDFSSCAIRDGFCKFNHILNFRLNIARRPLPLHVYSYSSKAHNIYKNYYIATYMAIT